MKALIKAGANIIAHDCWGHTPLHAAARFGHAHIVTELMQNGANKKIIDSRGFTPLDEAVKYRQRKTILVLI